MYIFSVRFGCLSIFTAGGVSVVSFISLRCSACSIVFLVLLVEYGLTA